MKATTTASVVCLQHERFILYLELLDSELGGTGKPSGVPVPPSLGSWSACRMTCEATCVGPSRPDAAGRCSWLACRGVWLDPARGQAGFPKLGSIRAAAAADGREPGGRFSYVLR